MSLTQITIGGRWTLPSGGGSQGQVVLTLSATLRNGTTEVSPASIPGTFDPSGRVCSPGLFPLIVDANDDAPTTPPGSSYEIDLTIDGTQLETFEAVISHLATAVDSAGVTATSTTITLGNLLASPTMVGQTITGTDIPGSTTVTGYAFVPSGAGAVNTLTISNPATGSHSGASFTIGGVVDLGALVPSVL